MSQLLNLEETLELVKTVPTPSFVYEARSIANLDRFTATVPELDGIRIEFDRQRLRSDYCEYDIRVYDGALQINKGCKTLGGEDPQDSGHNDRLAKAFDAIYDNKITEAVGKVQTYLRRQP